MRALEDGHVENIEIVIAPVRRQGDPRAVLRPGADRAGRDGAGCGRGHGRRDRGARPAGRAAGGPGAAGAVRAPVPEHVRGLAGRHRAVRRARPLRRRQRRRCAELLGRPESELRGSSVAAVHPPGRRCDSHRRAAHHAGRRRTASSVHVEKRYVRPSGEIRWAWLSVSQGRRPAGPGLDPRAHPGRHRAQAERAGAARLPRDADRDRPGRPLRAVRDGSAARGGRGACATWSGPARWRWSSRTATSSWSPPAKASTRWACAPRWARAR